MTVERLVEAVEKSEASFRPDATLQRALVTYSELVEKGYSKPKGYSLQSFEDKHRENAKYRITVIRTCGTR